MNLYVGNVSFDTTESKLTKLFEDFGEVESVRLIVDRETGRARGFGFVEMPNQEEAQAAIDQLHESEVDGRPLVVNEARPKRPRY